MATHIPSFWGLGQGPLWGPELCLHRGICSLMGRGVCSDSARVVSQFPKAAEPLCPPRVVGESTSCPASSHLCYLSPLFQGHGGQSPVVLRCFFSMLAFQFLSSFHEHTSSMQPPMTTPFAAKSAPLGWGVGDCRLTPAVVLRCSLL